MNQDHAYIHREWHRAASMRDLPALLALYADDATLTDTDIISAQHCWTGGLETAGPGCYDAVAIARAAGFRVLVMSPHPSCGDCP